MFRRIETKTGPPALSISRETRVDMGRLDAGDGQSRRATSPPKAPTPTANWFRTKRHASSTPPTMTPTSPLRFSSPTASLWAPIVSPLPRGALCICASMISTTPSRSRAIPTMPRYSSLMCQSSSNTRDSIRSAPKSPFCRPSPTPKYEFPYRIMNFHTG